MRNVSVWALPLNKAAVLDKSDFPDFHYSDAELNYTPYSKMIYILTNRRNKLVAAAPWIQFTFKCIF